MKKEFLKTKKGHKFIKLNINEMLKIGGLGICDSCCVPMSNGNLIPVLNSVYCDDCFNKWVKEAVYYKEDVQYEEQKTNQFLRMLNEK